MSILTNHFIFNHYSNKISPNTSHIFTETANECNINLLDVAEQIKNLNEIIFFISGKLNCKIVDFQRCLIKVLDKLRKYNINPVPYQILISIIDKTSILKFAKELVKEWNKLSLKMNDINYYEIVANPVVKKITDKDLCKVFDFFLCIENDKQTHRVFYFCEMIFKYFT
jgi:hypothetical protein